MKWRLQEGAGEAIYEIGVEDCGTFIGLKSRELKSSMNTLRLMAERYEFVLIHSHSTFTSIYYSSYVYTTCTLISSLIV